MRSLKKLYLRLGSRLFGRPFIETEAGYAEGAWAVGAGGKFFSPKDVGYYPGLESVELTYSGTFSEYGSKMYMKGGARDYFATKEHAEEAHRRMRKVLDDLHSELGY